MTELVRAKYCDAFMSKIAGFRYGDELCDVDVHVEGRVFKCHRLVLRAASEYFAIMFNGNFEEGYAKEVFLREIKANVFEEVLNFMYSGKAKICSLNLFDIIRAADFYKLPILLELCEEFIVETNPYTAEDIMKIFLYVRDMGMDQLVDALNQLIYQNLGYFSATPEFVDLDVDTLVRILEVVAKAGGEYPPGPVPLQDPFLEGIRTWITHQTNLTLEEKLLHSERLVQKIDFNKLSERYICYPRERIMEELVSSEVTNCEDWPSLRSPIRLLRAYVSKIDMDGTSLGTSIFTAPSCIAPDSWIYSGEMYRTCNYMRDIVIDGSIYSLRYTVPRQADASSPAQTFICSSSMSMYPYSSLSPPPHALNAYDLCGSANEIYVCNRYCSPFFNYTIGRLRCNSRERDEFNLGVHYSYKRDIDRWFPLPRPKMIYSGACMTCDEERVYLIGGAGSYHRVQAYDPRMKEWTVLPPTRHVYHNRAECSTYGKKIYLVGDDSELYDPISGHSQPLTHFNSSRCLANWSLPLSDTNMVVQYPRMLSFYSEIVYRNLDSPSDDNFLSLPNFFSIIDDSFSFIHLSVLDMLTF